MNNFGTGAKKFIVSFPRDCHAFAHNDIAYKTYVSWQARTITTSIVLRKNALNR